MRFLKYLQEEFMASVPSFSEPCNIYVDPSYKELTVGIKGDHVRFFVLDDKLYVWDAELATHHQIASKIKATSKALMGGLGKKLQGRIYYDPQDWANELFFKEDEPKNKIIGILKKNKNYFYNYEDMVNYYLSMKPVK